jgi:hypothetical protein
MPARRKFLSWRLPLNILSLAMQRERPSLEPTRQGGTAA